MRYLHTMVRVSDLDAALDFYCAKLGLTEIRRVTNDKGRFTLVFLAAPDDAARSGETSPMVELTWNWDPETYGGGRNFGHLAYAVKDIYALCGRLMAAGIVINRPPRDATWRSSVRRMESPSNCCRKANALRPKNPGHPCPTREVGDWSNFAFRRIAKMLYLFDCRGSGQKTAPHFSWNRSG